MIHAGVVWMATLCGYFFLFSSHLFLLFFASSCYFCVIFLYSSLTLSCFVLSSFPYLSFSFSLLVFSLHICIGLFAAPCDFCFALSTFFHPHLPHFIAYLFLPFSFLIFPIFLPPTPTCLALPLIPSLSIALSNSSSVLLIHLFICPSV